VVSRDAHGWADIEPERLTKLEPDEFERFCADLIYYEAFDRHDDPDPNGPPGRLGVKDGGRDILLTIKKAPLISKVAYQQKHHLRPLTEDALGRTAYSCKSGTGWLNLALGDFDPEKRKGLGRAVEVLLEGGYFKLLINTVGKLDGEVERKNKKQTPHKHLADALWARMKEVDASAGDPSDRIEILDAETLANFLVARQPEGGTIERWLQRFNLVPLLHSLDEWRALHVEDRAEPTFANDANRTTLRDNLLAFLRSASTAPSDRTAWLVGPPGVGKTRLVLETLASDPAVAQRVRVAWSYEEALGALDTDRLLVRHPTVVLVVDDCPSGYVDLLAARFRAAAGALSSARLLVITPASEHALREAKLSPRWVLVPLDLAATEMLARGELGGATEPEKVHEIARLSQGYPWFVRLLAHEAIAVGRLPQNRREAVKWALASRWEATEGPNLESLCLRRARCLLAASLTRRVDWDNIPVPDRDNIAHAVGLERWQELHDMALECGKRGILRRTQGWHFKYVTPLVLEREIIAWLLDPDEGPDPGGRTLAHYGQNYLEDFFETLAHLELPRALVTGIAQVGLRDLMDAPPDWSSLRAAGLLGPRLWFVARHAPGATARVLRRRIDASTLDELRARVDIRRGLMFALEELGTREDAFEDAEAALLRLAQAENEAYANNATSTWAGLFFVELNATHRPLDYRIRLLERRALDTEPGVRALAVTGVQAVLTTRAFRGAHEEVDGAWPTPTPEEARRARVRAWVLLAGLFADPDLAVATAAKRVALDELRGVIRAGVGNEAMAEIATRLGAFSEAERVKLRDVLAAMRMYDAGWLSPSGEYPKKLEDLLEPTSFRERLRQRVGVWGPAALRKNDAALDIALAREGLAGDAPIKQELDWLISDEAVRAHVFAYALGQCDVRGDLLTELRERAKAWRTAWKARLVFARYLGGWAEAGRSAEADAVLRDLRVDRDDAPVLALVIVELGATDERLAWIEKAAREGLLDTACVQELGRRHWLSRVSEEAFSSFVGVLVEGVAIEYAAAALELIVDQVNESPASASTLRKPMRRALERLASTRLHGITDYYWELGALSLIESGDTAYVADLAVIAIAYSRGANVHAWKALHAAAERDPSAAFRAVAGALEDPGPAAGRLLLAFTFHRTSFAWPADEVLAWVGHDEHRGRVAAALVRQRTAELSPVVRSLVKRFGPGSSVANEILTRMHSTDGLVPSLAEHDARRLRGRRAAPLRDLTRPGQAAANRSAGIC
jgi:hypothetical protein